MENHTCAIPEQTDLKYTGGLHMVLRFVTIMGSMGWLDVRPLVRQ